jgi:phosphohistidine phosphatase
MTRLFLLRHARAAWADPGTRDFDRTLEPGGLADAAALGAAMCTSDVLPETVICSTAKRARETWQAVARMIGRPYDSAQFTDALYSSDAAGYLEIVRNCEPTPSMMLVGHNPMMEDLAFALSGSGADEARSTLASGFPASGLAVLRFEGPLSGIAPSTGYLETFLTPGEL